MFASLNKSSGDRKALSEHLGSLDSTVSFKQMKFQKLNLTSLTSYTMMFSYKYFSISSILIKKSRVSISICSVLVVYTMSAFKTESSMIWRGMVL